MASPKPILLLIGAGPKVGLATAQKFLANGYRVALASRSQKATIPTASKDEVLDLICDVSSPSSIPPLFNQIHSHWSSQPSVVVYNACSMHKAQADDILGSVSVEDFVGDLNANSVSTFVAAREAVKGWRKGGVKDGVFFMTGNMLNEQTAVPGLLTLGVGKNAAAYMIAEAHLAYKDEGHRFYYADERTPEGVPMWNGVDGESHADFFWDLVANGQEERVKRVPWQATFTKGVGYRAFERGISRK